MTEVQISLARILVVLRSDSENVFTRYGTLPVSFRAQLVLRLCKWRRLITSFALRVASARAPALDQGPGTFGSLLLFPCACASRGACTCRRLFLVVLRGALPLDPNDGVIVSLISD